jgi:outer membrane receptor protein involved in Fe transport
VAGDWADREGSLLTNEGQQRTFRANLNLAPSDNVDVAVSTGFASTALELPNNDNSELGYIGVALTAFPWERPLVRDDPVTGEPGVATCAIDYEGALAFGVPLGTVGCAANPFFSGRTFDDVATISNRQEIERFTGSVATTYRPSGWLTAQGTVGYDIYSDQTDALVPPDEDLVFADLSLGFRTSNDIIGRNLTAEGSAIAAFDVTGSVRSTTTVGVQFFGDKLEATGSVGRGLPSGTGTVSNAVRTEGFEEVQETRTLGLFVEEQLSFEDRFFLTPAVRFDENSAFGENLGREAYPRVMASYVISESPWFDVGWIESLRLRGAWGESGRQPTSFAALQLLEAQRVAFRGQDVAGVAVLQPGNPDLKPERGSEVELGFEADLLQGRVAMDFTWYDKVTKDAIVTRRVAPSSGFPGVRFENIGEIANSGVELGVTAIAANTPDLFWTWQLIGATADGEITRLDDQIVFGLNGNSQRHVEGRPFGAYFSTDYAIGDDGSVVSTGEEVYLGHPTPEWEGSVSTTVRLYNRLTLYANVGFAGGHQQFNSTEEFRCGFLGGGENGGICPAIHERGPDGQLTDAARIKAAAASEIQYGPWIEDADFARLRTVGARIDLPATWAARLGASRADLTVTGENLALWTDYSGLDPEMNTVGADPAARAEFLTLPPGRRVTGRISITF